MVLCLSSKSNTDVFLWVPEVFALLCFKPLPIIPSLNTEGSSRVEGQTVVTQSGSHLVGTGEGWASSGGREKKAHVFLGSSPLERSIHPEAKTQVF